MLDILTYAAEIVACLIALPFVIAAGYYVMVFVIFASLWLIGVV